MFFKKRRQARELSESRRQVEEGFSTAIEEALRKEDLTQKVIDLQNISKKIGIAIASENFGADKKTDPVGIFGTAAMAVMGGALALMILAPQAMALAAFLMCGTMGCCAIGLVGLAVSMARNPAPKEKVDPLVAHKEKLTALQSLIDEKIKTILNENMEAISKAPASEYKTLKTMPGVAKKFKEADKAYKIARDKKWQYQKHMKLE